MIKPMSGAVMSAVFLLIAPAAFADTITLYDQDFENPAAFVNNGGDVNIFTTVNQNYGGQPAGFSFAQTYTVETLNVSGSDRDGGTAAFGTGWSDPSGKGGNFAIGMLSNVENDLLGLSFNVGSYSFFNVFVDISSIDLSTFGGPFVAEGAVPIFQFTLFDNPSGGVTTGSGTILDQFALTGTASARTVFDWTSGAFGLSTAGNTNGNVTLQIDLLQGGYAAFDNLVLQASDAPPPVVSPVPLPAGLPLLIGGVAALGLVRRRRR